MEKLLKRLMDHFNWKRVAILASTDDIWQIAANLVKIVFAKNNAGIEVAHFHSFIPGRLHVLESRIDGQADRIREATHKAKSKYISNSLAAYEKARENSMHGRAQALYDLYICYQNWRVIGREW